MHLDKKYAIKNKQRIPEATLMMISAIGGSVGMLIGMYWFHHKTRKIKFYVGVPSLLVLHIALIVLIYVIF